MTELKGNEPDIPVASPVNGNDSTEEEYGIHNQDNLDRSSSCEKNATDKIVGAAAIAGGVAGLVIAGPIIGAVGAVGAAALATQNNKAGDVARASGDVVLAAGQRAKEIDEKHHIVDKTKTAAQGVCQKGKEIDEKHHIVDKTKTAAGNLVKGAKEFEEKHKLGEKAGKTMTKGLQFVSDKLKPKDAK
jgi:hypothetical protein